MNNIWKIVAENWRTVDDASESLVSIEELTDEVTAEVLETGLLTSTYDYLDEVDDLDDEDDDWP